MLGKVLKSGNVYIVDDWVCLKEQIEELRAAENNVIRLDNIIYKSNIKRNRSIENDRVKKFHKLNKGKKK